MAKNKNNQKINMVVKNIYKEKTESNKIQDILLNSYKIFIQKEWKATDKCL